MRKVAALREHDILAAASSLRFLVGRKFANSEIENRKLEGGIVMDGRSMNKSDRVALLGVVSFFFGVLPGGFFLAWLDAKWLTRGVYVNCFGTSMENFIWLVIEAMGFGIIGFLAYLFFTIDESGSMVFKGTKLEFFVRTPTILVFSVVSCLNAVCAQFFVGNVPAEMLNDMPIVLNTQKLFRILLGGCAFLAGYVDMMIFAKFLHIYDDERPEESDAQDDAREAD